MSKIKKASLAEIFTACTGVICAGIAGYENLGGTAAKLHYTIREKLLDNGRSYTEEQAVNEMMAFLDRAADLLKYDPKRVLLRRPVKDFKTKKIRQLKLGTVSQLLAHINDIQRREVSGNDREVSKMSSVGIFNKVGVDYLNENGKPVKLEKTKDDTIPARRSKTPAAAL